MELISVIFVIVIIFLLVRTENLRKEIQHLHQRITGLSIQVAGFTYEKKSPEQEPVPAREKIPERPTVPPPPRAVTAPHAAHEKASGTGTSPDLGMQDEMEKRGMPPPLKGSIHPVKKAPGYEIWKRIERQCAENWIGIAGAVVLVLGIGFLGTYAALSLSPFFRFLMILGIAVALYMLSIVLKSRVMYVNIATWIQSSAGAVFLFGCLGAGGIPGLTWIENPATALGLLLLGIAVNLYLGYVGGTQVFISLHVLISLAALGIAPQSILTLIIAGAVTLFGVALTYRSRWEYHLITTISSFLMFQLYWYHAIGGFETQVLPLPQRITGITATALIGIAAAFVHYRELYRAERFAPLPFIAHLLNWLSMAVCFLLYSTGSMWNTLVFAAASIALFILARRARSLGIRWLYITDTLIAQSVALFCIYTLNRWGLDAPFIALAAFVEVLIFLIMMILEGQALLQRIGLLMHALTIGIIITEGITSFGSASSLVIQKNALILAAVIIIEVLFHVMTLRRYAWDIDSVTLPFNEGSAIKVSLSGIAPGILLLIVMGFLYPYAWSGYVLIAAGIGLYIVRRRYQSQGLLLGLLLFMAIAHAVCWIHAYNVKLQGSPMLLYGLPYFALTCSSLWCSSIDSLKKHILWPGIYLFTLHLVYCTYRIFGPVSPFIPGVVWILLSVVYLEISRSVRNRVQDRFDGRGDPDRFILHMGYLFIVLFLARHVLVHMQSELYLGGIKLRLMVEILGLAIFMYWALARRPARAESIAVWKYVHPLFWELFVVFSVFVVALEVRFAWHPVVWILYAFVLFVIGRQFRTISRFCFYSLLFYWIAAFHVAFISSTHVTPSHALLDQAWVSGGVSVFLQFCLCVLYHRQIKSVTIEFPFASNRLSRILVQIRRRQNLWIYYPLFIATALFLYWSFDKSILTLLWVMEAFAIFIVSILVRENHFRYLSMTGLAVCLARLLFFDLSQSGTLTRIVVFMGVGGIMIVMNMIYNKYKAMLAT